MESGIPQLRDLRSAADEGVISPKYLFEPGDVLYSKLRPYLRKVAVARFRGVCSADMYPLRPVRELVEPDYLALLLLSDEFTTYASDESRRARMPKLNREQLFSWSFALPTLDIQRRVSHRLEQAFEQTQRARASTEAQVRALDAIERGLLRDIFDSRLATAWPRKAVSALCERIDYGHTAAADFGRHSPRFLRITDIQDGKVDWSTVPGCPIEPDAEELLALADGDIVFARTGATTGKSFLVRTPPRAVFASYLIRLRPTSEVRPEYLSAFFQSDGYWAQIRRHARGGAQPNVNATLLGSILVPVALPEVQDRVVSGFETQSARARTARRRVQEVAAAVTALPAALLRQAFSGKL
jgi:type I restriction enzyme S subunit